MELCLDLRQTDDDLFFLSLKIGCFVGLTTLWESECWLVNVIQSKNIIY